MLNEQYPVHTLTLQSAYYSMTTLTWQPGLQVCCSSRSWYVTWPCPRFVKGRQEHVSIFLGDICCVGEAWMVFGQQQNMYLS